MQSIMSSLKSLIELNKYAVDAWFVTERVAPIIIDIANQLQIEI